MSEKYCDVEYKDIKIGDEYNFGGLRDFKWHLVSNCGPRCEVMFIEYLKAGYYTGVRVRRKIVKRKIG